MSPDALARIARALAGGDAVRVVNYHLTPRHRAAEYDAEFAGLARRFDPVDEDGLDLYLRGHRWRGGRPGVIPAFYNGYRDNFDVALPLLEKHGLTGWFFAVPGYTSCPVPEQLAWGAARRLRTLDAEYADGRYALSWDELRRIEARGHVVASHTRTHSRVDMDDPAAIEDEIVGAQRDFAEGLGHPVRSFAWLLGGRYGENPDADAAVDRAGYDFLFSNLALQRLPGPMRPKA